MERDRGHVWTDADFHYLGWSGCRLYSVTLPAVPHPLVLHLDYILESPLNSTSPGFLVAPAKLSFFDPVNVKLDLAIGHNGAVDLVTITRSDERPTPNRKLQYRDYAIETDAGFISLTATAIEQEVMADASNSLTSTLGREGDFI
jgi:hypothetical protein